MKFRVIDKLTGKEADPWNIALREEWAQGLIYCDMEGFAITEDGYLVLMDECGHVEYCDTERFKVVFEDEQPHGEWVQVRDKRGRLISRKCPFCKAYHVGMLNNFCPNCGARMVVNENET